MADNHLPPPAELRKLLRYEPETGKLYWLDRPGTTRGERYFNTRYGGKEALTSLNRGYPSGCINSQTAKAHRVAWALYHGEWPDGLIDHINGDRSDNRLSNLRVVSHSENGRNAKRRSHNTSGANGVQWVKRTQRWRVMLKVDGREKYIGTFSTFDDAVTARKRADQHHGFSAIHGR